MESLGDEIRKFVDTYIDCMDQLESLRILASDSEQGWNTAALAKAVQSDSPAMEANLAILEERGLVARLHRNGQVWQYKPSTLELRLISQSFLRSYLQRPVTVIRMVCSPKRGGRQTMTPRAAISEAYPT